MRAVMLAIVLSTAGAVAATAQLKPVRAVQLNPDLGEQDVTVGVIGGLSFAEISGDSVAPASGVRTSFAAGLTASVPINRTFAIEPDLLYIRKGAGGSIVQGGQSASGGFALDYGEFSLLLRAALQPEGDLRPLLFAGPMAAVRLRCALTGSFSALAPQYDCGQDVQKVDYGVVLGVGADLPRGDHSWTFLARYEIGLRDQLKQISPYQFRTRAFLLTAAYSLHLN